MNIRHLEGGGVQLIAGAHGADNGGARILCRLHQHQLAGDGVDGVHHIVILGKVKLLCSFRQVKGLNGAGNTIRIDGAGSAGGGFCLIHTHGVHRCQNLAVDVGPADGIMVHKIQCAHTAAGQGLHHIAAHTA